ncbi:MAG: hypothetical protein ACOX6D_05415 [Thermoguttaceae bacterium]|jgi:hypothetical protein
MAEQKLDVYRDWLKITATNRPLNYYQILKLKTFEDNMALIRDHYRKLNAHVRKFATGEYIDESQELLNELAKGMLCLTDKDRKAEYDATLGRKTETAEADRSGSFDDILIRNNVVTAENLKKAKSYAEAVGLDLHMAILQQRLASQEQVMLAYAESEGLPFVNLDEIPVDEYYAPQIDPNMARSHSFVPVMADMGRLILASPVPLSLDVEEQLRVLFDMPIRSAICTPGQVNIAIAKYYPRDAVQQIVARSDKSTKGKNAGKKEGKETTVKVKKDRSTAPPLTAQGKKNRLLITVMAFCFSVMIGFFGGYLSQGARARISDGLIPALILAALCAPLAWFLGGKFCEREDE